MVSNRSKIGADFDILIKFGYDNEFGGFTGDNPLPETKQTQFPDAYISTQTIVPPKVNPWQNDAL